MMDVVEKVSDKIVLINEGTVIANGTFEELQQQLGNNSLENIFAQLTSKEDLADAADKLMNAFK